MNIRRLSLILSLMLLVGGTAHADVIRSGSLEARSDGVNITIRWTTEDETQVARFEVERRADGEVNFTSVGSVEVKGPSDYEFVDRTVFRKVATLYYYRIKILLSSGATPVYSVEIPVSHAVSGVRRTWGSIKAMFR